MTDSEDGTRVGSRRRRLGLVVVLGSTLALAAVVLERVLGTLFFAITVAYVLYPFHRRLVAGGVPPRLASGTLMLGASGIVVAVLWPLVNVVNRRRREIVVFVGALPDVLTVQVGPYTYAVRTVVVDATVRTTLLRAASDAAGTLPTLVLKVVLFATVVYALLLAPNATRRIVIDVVPPSLHDVVHAFHVRIRDTLYAIYGLQSAMGVLGFLVGLVLFTALGYEVAFPLAVAAGVLQFIPVIGPILLVVLLGGYELALGDPVQGLVVLGVGTLLYPIVLDTVIRPQLARRTAILPGSLYLTGFIGGVVSLGPIGIVAGPLVVAVVVEAVEQLTRESTRQTGGGTHGDPDE